MSEKKEYIERGALIAKFEALKEGANLRDALYLNGVQAAIETFTAADVEPVVRGEWRDTTVDGDLAAYSTCSRCGYTYNSGQFVAKIAKSFRTRLHNFCPNCGAHMSIERSGSGE